MTLKPAKCLRKVCSTNKGQQKKILFKDSKKKKDKTFCFYYVTSLQGLNFRVDGGTRVQNFKISHKRTLRVGDFHPPKIHHFPRIFLFETKIKIPWHPDEFCVISPQLIYKFGYFTPPGAESAQCCDARHRLWRGSSN